MALGYLLVGTVTEWLSLGLTPAYKKYLNTSEFTDEGAANADYRLSIAPSFTLLYKKLSLGMLINNSQTIKYAGWEDSYSYLVRSTLSYTWDAHYSMYAMLDTGNNQIENDHKTAVVYYNREVSTFAMGVTYSM